MKDYEKKYNEALKDMRAIYPNLKGDAKLAVEHAFPELAESEDERIRNNIIASVEMNGELTQARKSEIYAYLENLKEATPCSADEFTLTLRNCLSTDSELTKEQADIFAAVYGKELLNVAIGKVKSGLTKEDISDFKTEKQKEQEPADEAENFFDSAESYHQGFIAGQKKMKEDIEKGFGIGEHSLDYLAGRFAGYETAKAEQRFEEAREKYQVKWSEEDEDMLNSIIEEIKGNIQYGDALAIIYGNKRLDWLKSLRPSWKPSEEQMDALDVAATDYKELDELDVAVLKMLYNDLKKLM